MKLVVPKAVGTPATGEEVEGLSPACIGGVGKVRAEIHRLNQTVQSRQNAVNFFHSRLDEVQRENDKLRIRFVNWRWN